jgi:hypothetical protein
MLCPSPLPSPREERGERGISVEPHLENPHIAPIQIAMEMRNVLMHTRDTTS